MRPEFDGHDSKVERYSYNIYDHSILNAEVLERSSRKRVEWIPPHRAKLARLRRHAACADSSRGVLLWHVAPAHYEPCMACLRPLSGCSDMASASRRDADQLTCAVCSLCCACREVILSFLCGSIFNGPMARYQYVSRGDQAHRNIILTRKLRKDMIKWKQMKAIHYVKVSCISAKEWRKHISSSWHMKIWTNTECSRKNGAHNWSGLVSHTSATFILWVFVSG